MKHLLAAFRERVRQRPDSEHAQALLRAVIVCLLFINTAWIAARDPAAGARLWTINSFSALFSLLLLFRILQRPHASSRRRVLGAVHDNVAVTAWLYSCGPMGALALFVYPFVTVGNGFRFGVRYLAASGLLGAVGIATLFAAAPGWTAFGAIGAGVLLSHVVVTGYTGVLLGQLRQTQDRLEHMASSDALTGLPNRRSFMERLTGILSSPGRGHLACLYLDLDGFKGVNDRCGHKAGDQLLATAAAALVGCLRSTDLVARLGGDEFTVVLDNLSAPEDARTVAARIVQVIEAIDTIDGEPVVVSVSIGISFLPAAGAGRPVLSDEMVRAADDAMYSAKRSGRGLYRFIDLADPPRDAAA